MRAKGGHALVPGYVVSTEDGAYAKYAQHARIRAVANPHYLHKLVIYLTVQLVGLPRWASRKRS